MRDFLQAIWGDLNGQFGELRAIKEGVVRQSYHSSPAELEADAALLNAKGYDVYFGVRPRGVASGKGESISDETPVMWADFDAKAFGAGKGQAFQALASVAPEAHIVVDSGNGYHAYWLLDRGYPFADVQEVMKGIAIVAGADKTYDKARILRVPGTDNHKTQPANPVRLLRFDLTARRHRLSDFVGYAEAATPPPVPRREIPERTGPAPAVDDLPSWLARLIVEGAENEDRSLDCFKVACQLIERGYSDEEIEDIFADHPDGIGEKYAEKGRRGPSWMAYTLRAAHASVERGR